MRSSFLLRVAKNVVVLVFVAAAVVVAVVVVAVGCGDILVRCDFLCHSKDKFLPRQDTQKHDLVRGWCLRIRYMELL